MHASDREEFLRELSKLCGGFNVPMSKGREEGYWVGLARMSLAQFRRCVEHALGENYDGDQFPTTRQIWRIYKGTAIAQPAQSTRLLPPDQDHLAYFANRLLFMHMTHRAGLGSTGTFIPGEAGKSGMNDCHASDELARCLKFKRELVAQFCGFVHEGDELTPADFIRWWIAGLRKVSEVLPRTVQALETMAQSPDASKPLPAYMARELNAQSEAA